MGVAYYKVWTHSASFMQSQIVLCIPGNVCVQISPKFGSRLSKLLTLLLLVETSSFNTQSMSRLTGAPDLVYLTGILAFYFAPPVPLPHAQKVSLSNLTKAGEVGV
jgi:hypothetical protein